MKKNLTITVVVLVLVVIGLYFYYGSNKQGNYGAPAGQNTSPELFSNSPMSQYAYLISVPNYDASTQKALAGFTVTKKTLADGSMQITLNAQNPEYKTQIYTVKTGEKLYFIEKSLGDDSDNQDKFLGDDTAVLVDAGGYIVGQ